MNLIEAIEQGDVYHVRFLLADDWIDPTFDDNKAIKMACLNWHTDIVELLLQDGRADPTADSNLAILYTSTNGYTDVVALLLKDGRANPTASGNWAIRFASLNGHTKVVSLLLEDGRVDPSDIVIRAAATEEIKDMLVKYKYRVDGKEYCKLKNLIDK